MLEEGRKAGAEERACPFLSASYFIGVVSAKVSHPGRGNDSSPVSLVVSHTGTTRAQSGKQKQHQVNEMKDQIRIRKLKKRKGDTEVKEISNPREQLPPKG